MLKRLFALCSGLCLIASMHQAADASIVMTSSIEDILLEATPGTLVLFDIDQTLIDSTTTLGSGHWNKFLKKKIADGKYFHSNLYDEVTQYVTKNAMFKPVEDAIPSVIQALQNSSVTAMGFSEKDKIEWFPTYVERIDELTRQQLNQAGIFLEQTVLPKNFNKLNPSSPFSPSLGIFFASQIPRDQFLIALFSIFSYTPDKVIFVDDKMKHVQKVAQALDDSEIPNVCYYYPLVEWQSPAFDSTIGIIQLKKLVDECYIPSDEEAARIRGSFAESDADTVLDNLLQYLDTTLP